VGGWWICLGGVFFFVWVVSCSGGGVKEAGMGWRVGKCECVCFGFGGWVGFCSGSGPYIFVCIHHVCMCEWIANQNVCGTIYIY